MQVFRSETTKLSFLEVFQFFELLDVLQLNRTIKLNQAELSKLLMSTSKT